VRRYEEKIKLDRTEKVTKECWKMQEKEQYKWKNKYGRKRERYYIRNSLGMGIDEVRDR